MKLVLIAVVLVAIGVAILVMLQKPRTGTEAYKRRKLMTANELEFFGRLVTALPAHFIFPQVALSALLEASSSDKKKAHSDRLRIAQQRADYVVCDANGEVIAVVELDDKTHSRSKDQTRDARLEQAGIRTVRFESRNKPTPDVIRSRVLIESLSLPAHVSDLHHAET